MKRKRGTATRVRERAQARGLGLEFKKWDADERVRAAAGAASTYVEYMRRQVTLTEARSPARVFELVVPGVWVWV